MKYKNIILTLFCLFGLTSFCFADDNYCNNIDIQKNKCYPTTDADGNVVYIKKTEARKLTVIKDSKVSKDNEAKKLKPLKLDDDLDM